MSKAVRPVNTPTKASFRSEVQKAMPGYKWTFHRSSVPEMFLSATGIQSRGFNRLSTLRVEWSFHRGISSYKVSSSGTGTKAPIVHTVAGSTLLRALRELQQWYKNQAQDFAKLESDLQTGRRPVATFE